MCLVFNWNPSNIYSTEKLHIFSSHFYALKSRNFHLPWCKRVSKRTLYMPHLWSMSILLKSCRPCTGYTPVPGTCYVLVNTYQKYFSKKKLPTSLVYIWVSFWYVSNTYLSLYVTGEIEAHNFLFILLKEMCSI